MKRYKANLSICLSGRSKKEVELQLKRFIENGAIVQSGCITKIKLFEKPNIEQLPF
jgi:hypothetical protein